MSQLGPEFGQRSDHDGLDVGDPGVIQSGLGRIRLENAIWRSHFVLSGRILLLPGETGLAPDISKRRRYNMGTIKERVHQVQNVADHYTGNRLYSVYLEKRPAA
jgi:hypothetical protein